jgi:hypothetical protein
MSVNAQNFYTRDLHWLAVACFPKNLRSHVAWCSARGGKNVELLLIHDSRQSEVRDQQIRVVLWCSEKKVLRLQVSMYDAVVVKICNCGQGCSHEVGRVGFVVVAFATDAIEELASKREVSDKVDCRDGQLCAFFLEPRRVVRLFMVSK